MHTYVYTHTHINDYIIMGICIYMHMCIYMGFPGGSDDKESAYNAGDLGLISGSGSYPGNGNGNPLQYSCLENSRNRGAWWATVHGVVHS